MSALLKKSIILALVLLIPVIANCLCIDCLNPFHKTASSPRKALPTISPSRSKDPRVEAQSVINKLQKELEKRKQQFDNVPGDRNTPGWIQERIIYLSENDQLIRMTFINNIVDRPWPLPVKREFLDYFMNLDDANAPFDQQGLVRQTEITNYYELKESLENNFLFRPEHWPAISKFGKATDYYAFLIMLQGKSLDKNWQDKYYVPRLMNLCGKGESASVAYAWYKDPQPENYSRLIPLLKKQGPPWSEQIPRLQKMELFYKLLPDIQKVPRSNPAAAE